MKRIELEKAFRSHVKEVHGEKALREFAGSELEGLCITFLQKQLKLLAIPDVSPRYVPEVLIWKEKFPNEEFNWDSYYDWCNENTGEAFVLSMKIHNSLNDRQRVTV